VTESLLLALGLLLTLASQLRPAGLPVGPGEACLILWLLLALGREAVRSGPPLTPALSRLVVFWVIFTLAQCIGTLTGVMIGDRHDTGLFMHDIVAYALLGAVSCLSVCDPGASARLQRAARITVAAGAIVLAAQLAGGFIIPIPSTDPWYWDRFRGWSENPNQLAVLCGALVFLAVHVMETAAVPRARMAAVACLILALVVGWLTKSGTFRIAMAASGPVFLTLKFRGWILAAGSRLTLRAAFVLILGCGLPLLVVSAAPLATLVRISGSDLGKENNRDAEREAQVRLDAWSDAIRRGMESGLLGLGPGPHLPIPPSILEARMGGSGGKPKNVEHPAPGAAPNFEAHNTYLDLFTQGGLLATGVFVWLIGTAVLTAYKARLAGLTTAMCSLGVFTTNHLIVRLPIFWFVIALCLIAGTDRAIKPALQNRSR
jgi:hypothetical protein